MEEDITFFQIIMEEMVFKKLKLILIYGEIMKKDKNGCKSNKEEKNKTKLLFNQVKLNKLALKMRKRNKSFISNQL